VASLIFNRTLYNLGARAYDVFTQQPVWNAQVGKVLDHWSGAQSPTRVLDLGCGPGGSTFALAERLEPTAELVGVDLAAMMIERARNHHTTRFSHMENIEFRCEDAAQLPFPNNHFSFVVGHSFLYLVPEPVAVLREVFRLLKPGGTLVLMEPKEGGSLLHAMRTRFELADAMRGPRLGNLKFLASMVSWRAVSLAKGRLTSDGVAALFEKAGFAEVAVHSTLGGLGIHCVGRM